VLAAACLALNQRGEGSSPSGPTGRSRVCQRTSGCGRAVQSTGFGSRVSLVRIQPSRLGNGRASQQSAMAAVSKTAELKHALRVRPPLLPLGVGAWLGRQSVDHPRSERGMLWVRLPPGPLRLLRYALAVPARSGRLVLSQEIVGSNPTQGAVSDPEVAEGPGRDPGN
jgi:hypothetical protein